MEYTDIASGLSTKPTFIWQIYSPVSGTCKLLMSYLIEGLGWKASYVLKSNAPDTEADIRGWVNIDNRAGMTYENVVLKLVSGDVNLVSSPVQLLFERAEEAVAEEQAVPAFSEESLSEYHLYTLDIPATLKNNEVKQISLLSADSVPVKKELIFDVSKSSDIQAVLNLTNSKQKSLGMPLPAGVVRVYKADSEGQLQFLGEDSIDHTPKDEEIEIAVGSAFDITGTRTQTDYKRVSDNVWRESYEIELKNHKSEAQNVRIVEHFYGDWEIIKNSDTYRKTDAYTAEWEVTVPADGSKKITFTVERRY